jgi:hypothetical protein
MNFAGVESSGFSLLLICKPIKPTANKAKLEGSGTEVGGSCSVVGANTPLKFLILK